MTSIATFINRVRQDLHDESEDRWTDAVLTRHIERAIREYSLAAPQQKTSTIATTPGSRDVSIGALTDLIGVEAVEWPVGEFPPTYVRFSVWGSTLSLLTYNTGDGTNLKVYYGAQHNVDGSTLPAQHDETIARGAAGYAAVEWANYGINRVNVGGEDVEASYRKWGDQALKDFRGELDRLRRVLRLGRMFTPERSQVSQTGDFGP